MASSSGSSSSSFHEPFEKAYDALLELASKNARKHSSLIESLRARRERLKNVPDDDLHDDNDTFYEKRTEDLEYFLEPIEIAFKSKHASMEERAVICLTSLIGGRMITGRCFEEEEDKEDKAENEEDSKDNLEKEDKEKKRVGGEKTEHTRRERLCAKVVDLLCFACGESGDESVELQALLGVLACYMSRSFRVSGKMLSRMIESVCNCHAISRSETNRGVAKAALVQMIFANFTRVEKGDSSAFSKMVKVSDVLGGGGGGGGVGGRNDAAKDDTKDDVKDSTNLPSTSYETHVMRENSSMPRISSSHYTGQHHHWSDEIVTFAQKFIAKAASCGKTPQAYAPHSSEEKKAKAENDRYILEDCAEIFRALSRIAKGAGLKTANADAASISRGKLLALDALRIACQNVGNAFVDDPIFSDTIREYVLDAVVSNAISETVQAPELYKISLGIFQSILCTQRFREKLKSEIGFFFPRLFLDPLEFISGGAPNSPHSKRSVLLTILSDTVAQDAQTLVDLFVNFDCDISQQNAFERLINLLVRVAQGVEVSNLSGADAARETVLKMEALGCLTKILKALGDWVEQNSSSGNKEEQRVAHEMKSNVTKHVEDTESMMITPTKVDASNLVQKKLDKSEFQECVKLFNKKPKKGIAHLKAIGKLGEGTPADIATFLRTAPNLDKTVVGDYLGEREDENLKVMRAYVDAMDFSGFGLDEAIRKFLEGFRLPGESQKIDRLMEKFAERYHAQNPSQYRSADTAYVLAFSVIMLNTDAHNPGVKNKMTKEGFLKNNRGIDDGQDLDQEELGALYDRIVNNEIKLKDENAKKASNNESSSNLNNFLGMDILLSLVGQKPAIAEEKIDVRELIEEVRAKAKREDVDSFLSASDAKCAAPMLDVSWQALLAVFSVTFEGTESAKIAVLCLDGFFSSIHMACNLGMLAARDAFVAPLARLCGLRNPSTMRTKNILALKTLVRVGETFGDSLGDTCWVHVLKCCSRYEHLHALAGGFDDSSVFLNTKDEIIVPSGLGGHTPNRLFRRDSSAEIILTSPSTTTMRATGTDASSGDDALAAAAVAEQLARKASMHDAKISLVPLESVAPPSQHVLEQLHPDSFNGLFHDSKRLSGEAIVDFMRALCRLATEEMSAERPRSCALSKLVETCAFNVERERYVWAKAWIVLSDFFVKVGSEHRNVKVSMFVVDALRQLSMKFLQRAELANYSFQNDFLRPFVVIMQQSPSFEVRELIVSCVAQMVESAVDGIKSGWKSVFMVYSVAAADENPKVVSTAFSTIERIIRHNFSKIIETDQAAFTDCVNCLVAFTNSYDAPEVSLNALAFLRYCALQLADGALGDLSLPKVKASTSGGGNEDSRDDDDESFQQQHQEPSTPREKGPTHFTDTESHTYFWFPLLAGLSELAFDFREDIRTSSLEVLFDTLKFHGSSFEPGFWARVYDAILFPMFDVVRATEFDSSEASEKQKNEWLYGACDRCLTLVVDLATTESFFGNIIDAGVWPKLCDLLDNISGTFAHEQLASCGALAFRRLLEGLGKNTTKTRLNTNEWSLAVDKLCNVFDLRHPSVLLVDCVGECLHKSRKSMPTECKKMLFERMQFIHEEEKFDMSLRVNAGSVLVAFCDQDEEDIRFLQRAMVFALHEYERCASCVGSETARKETSTRVPLAVQCLKQLVKIDGAFEKKKFVDILSRLVGTNEQPNEVLSALGEVFGVKVAPLMIVTGEGDGESSFSAWSWF